MQVEVAVGVGNDETGSCDGSGDGHWNRRWWWCPLLLLMLVAGAVAGAVALAVLVACEWGRVLQWQQQREWAVWGSKAKQHKARKKTAKKPAPASPTGTAGSLCAADSLGRAGCYAQRIRMKGVQPSNEPHTTANPGKRMVELLLLGISGLLWDSNQGPCQNVTNKYATFRLPSWSPTLVLTKLDHA